jgi:hypothetical protein
MMSENPPRTQEFLEAAKHQFAQISAEFEKALEALKDQERRKQMASSYLDMLQKGLSRAQEGVAKYQEKIAPHPKPGPPEDASAPDLSGAPAPKVATPESEPAGPEPPTR